MELRSLGKWMFTLYCSPSNSSDNGVCLTKWTNLAKYLKVFVYYKYLHILKFIYDFSSKGITDMFPTKKEKWLVPHSSTYISKRFYIPPFNINGDNLIEVVHAPNLAWLIFDKENDLKLKQVHSCTPILHHFLDIYWMKLFDNSIPRSKANWNLLLPNSSLWPTNGNHNLENAA